jgi:hypothetical protein
MNNNFFTITRYLRDLGVDAHLYLIKNNQEWHFHPSADTNIDLTGVDWIKTFPVGYDIKSLIFRDKSSLEVFNEYDYLITCGLSTGILNDAGYRTDLFIPYGSDLIFTPFFRWPNNTNILKFLGKSFASFYRSKMQANGIKASGKIISNSNWAFAETAIEELGVKSVNLPRLMIYKEEETILDATWDFFSQNDFVIFSPTRHVWKTNPYPLPDFKENGGSKRNDKLIKAYARFLSETSFRSPMLILFEYGQDVEESKLLIESLKIEQYCKWVSILPRKVVTQGMKRSHIVADQFRVGMCSTSAGVTNEALSLGIPVVTNTDRAIFNPEDPYFNAPILEALEEQDIYEVLKDYEGRPVYYQELGRKGQAWFDDNLGIGLAKKYLEILTDSA